MPRSADNLNLAVFTPGSVAVSETFIRAHIEALPFRVFHIKGPFHASRASSITGVCHLVSRLLRRLTPALHRRLVTPKIRHRLRVNAIDVALAEYGPVGVTVMDACRAEGIPLVVHFHGFDASRTDVLKRWGTEYRHMFDFAAAVISVSKPMFASLVALGCNPEKLHLIHYGVDETLFRREVKADPIYTFLAVGRFVDKKSPLSTIRAFAIVHALRPTVTMVMVGEGPLLLAARQLIREMNLDSAITLLGARPNEEVLELYRQSQIFVQHSVMASNGDSEGAPVAIIEAQMSGLPVISTKHAGIPEIVEDGVSGLLVQEHDVEAMADAMMRISSDGLLRKKMSAAALRRARKNFSRDSQLELLAQVLSEVAT